MILTLCRFEWRPSSPLLGVFWRHGDIKTDEGLKRLYTDVFIFLIPCVPLRLTFVRNIVIPSDGVDGGESV